MKFLYIDQGAARELISERRLQSAEFEFGRLFVSFVKGEIPSLRIAKDVAATEHANGGYVVKEKNRSFNFIVYDLEENSNFLQLDSNGILLVLQKTLRFAIKLWDGLKPSVNERILSNNKAVVFPYPIGMQTELRVAFDRNPDPKRKKEGAQGSPILAYKFSDTEGGGVDEVAKYTNFRKASENRDDACRRVESFLQQAKTEGSKIGLSLAVTELASQEMPKPAFHVGLDGWLESLTTAQNEFVTRELDVPHRIEGPAGTGKTLSLVLKCLYSLKVAKEADREYRTLFVAHSEATKRVIENLLLTHGQDDFLQATGDVLNSGQYVRVTTLQALCADLLHQEISESELVDRDAYESKLVQDLYAGEAIEKVMAGEFASHKAFLSPSFQEFLANTDRWVVAEMLRHEISVQIKGRADQDLTKYKKLRRLKVGLPIENEGDHAFVFLMYERYQSELVGAGVFDTDDVVLSAISQLNTPIWRRRRVKEGYDNIFIDETHLFNLNELSVFHRLTRQESRQPIAYSVDRSQALGDRGWTNEAFEFAFSPSAALKESAPTAVNSIFRCSPDIVNLAFSVTSSGATLFTNFHNPLTMAISAFTAEEERKTSQPVLRHYTSDEGMLVDAFHRAEILSKDMGVAKADVVIIAFADDLFRELQARARAQNKPVEVVKSRGDLEAVNRARGSGRFVLTAPEYVGGLEFAGAVLVGVDGGRVPQKGGSSYEESQSFLSYASHQRVYVALTRARFRVEILGVKARGVSSLLLSAVDAKLLEVVDV
ncbi:UvrD-helicase domain-containing protein [Polaromonas sp. SM01]|uniref:UvrD-helicase domain-containing protein n=1 Tax=Polaromonas sp. SM01 TaxID=3085630 RepID=UPI002981CF38|nr:UvrD-helicase domain-containing protein [Polaromonas sp. SM01]MDW5444837.1 UvrD-helicase domain-containing protein [Polaromonas sp. SM01]